MQALYTPVTLAMQLVIWTGPLAALCSMSDFGRLLQDGVTVKKTTSALVIGIYGEGVQPADGNIVVENLADYLIGQGI